MFLPPSPGPPVAAAAAVAVAAVVVVAAAAAGNAGAVQVPSCPSLLQLPWFEMAMQTETGFFGAVAM